MSSKFIVIEGIDGSGKGTQSTLLRDHFLEVGYKVEMDDYPRYETSAWGKLVGRMLMGEFGNPLEISPYLSVLPYMIDEYFGSKDIVKWLAEGKMVISNRYFTSNVHGVAKLEGEDQIKFRDWLWKTGWDEMKIKKPDLVIVLLVEPEVCKEMIKQKQKRNYTGTEHDDVVEKSLDHQMKSAKEYQRMTENDDTWVTINCCDESGKIMDIDEIHKMIKNVINEKLNI